MTKSSASFLYWALVCTLAAGNDFSACVIAFCACAPAGPGSNETSTICGSLPPGANVSSVFDGMIRPVIRFGSLYSPATVRCSLLSSMLVRLKVSPVLRSCDLANCSSISAWSGVRSRSSLSDPPFSQSNL